VKDNSGLLLPAVSNEPDAPTTETQFEQARRLMADKAYYQAALLLYKAAIQGHSRSQCHLGLLYLKGLGVPRSAHHACSWLYLAAQQQEKAAIAAYAALQKKLTSQQLTAARRQAARYFEQIAASPNNSEQDYA
jgi:TPR repeat protein